MRSYLPLCHHSCEDLRYIVPGVQGSLNGVYVFWDWLWNVPLMKAL